MTAPPDGAGAAPRAGSEAGFTLIEMLVALALFALVGLACFAVLDTVIRTRDRTETRLETVAEIDRALILFGRDLGQSLPGSAELDDGALRVGRAGGALVWGLVDGALTRTSLDADGAIGVAQPLVAGVAETGWRFLDATGWQPDWPPEAGAGDLRAVEIRVTLAGGGALGPQPLTLRRLAEVPRTATP